MKFPPQCYYFFYTRILADPGSVLRELANSIEDSLNMKIFLPSGLNVEIRPLGPSARGVYDPTARKIVLSKGESCRKTFIHEILHAASYFSWVRELYDLAVREREFVEGLTEFVTGYVLFRKYPECYRNWIRGPLAHPVCAISYERYVRLLGALAQTIVSLPDLIRLLIYNPNVNWFDEYNSFLQRYGFEDFLVNKPKRKVLTQTIIVDSAVKLLKQKGDEEAAEEFVELLYEAPLSDVLDFSKMKS